MPAPRADRPRGDAPPVHAPRELGSARGLHHRRARRRHGRLRPRRVARPRRRGPHLRHTSVVEPAAWGLGIAEALAGWGEDRCGRSRPGTRPTGAPGSRGSCSTGTPSSSGGLPTAATRRCAGTPRCSGPTWTTSRGPACPTATRSARRREDELPAVFEMSVEAFPEHWGESEADEQRLDGMGRRPALPARPPGRRLEGRRARRARLQRGRDQADGSLRGLLDGVCDASRATGAAGSRGRRSPRASSCSATRARRARTSAWTPTITTGRSRSTSRAGSARSRGAPRTGSRSTGRSQHHDHHRAGAADRGRRRRRPSRASCSVTRRAPTGTRSRPS